MWRVRCINDAKNQNSIFQEGDLMAEPDDRQHRSILQEIAHRAMLDRGLVPDFPIQALAELERIRGPAKVLISIADFDAAV